MVEPIGNGDHGQVGRDPAGKFTAGNRAAAGHARPFAQQAAALRRAFYHAVGEEDLRAVARKLIDKAIDGDLVAAKLVLLWTLGKPPEPVWPDATPPGDSEVPPADLPRPLERTTDPTYQARLQAAARQLGPVILAARQALSAPPGATNGQASDSP